MSTPPQDEMGDLEPQDEDAEGVHGGYTLQGTMTSQTYDMLSNAIKPATTVAMSSTSNLK